MRQSCAAAGEGVGEAGGAEQRLSPPSPGAALKTGVVSLVSAGVRKALSTTVCRGSVCVCVAQFFVINELCSVYGLCV